MQEFHAVFQLTKTIIFQVGYYTLSTNSTPHFRTSAAQFARNKRDYTQCGQAQNCLLRGHPTAMTFFKKWDVHHLHQLTPDEYAELMEDMERLKAVYNFIVEELEESRRPYNPHFGFHRLAEWTKQDPASRRKMTRRV